MIVVAKANLLCKLSLFLLIWRRSIQTIKPNPPKTIRRLIVNKTIGISVNEIRLFPNKSKPALQKADIAWKMPNQIPWGIPYLGINWEDKIVAPINWMRKEILRIDKANLNSPDLVSKFIESLNKIRVLKLILLRRIEKNSTGIDMKPIPPISIKNKITIWPNALNWLWIARGDNPVTQVADVAIKNESIQLMFCPYLELRGSFNKTVPITMIQVKIIVIVLAVEFFFWFSFFY